MFRESYGLGKIGNCIDQLIEFLQKKKSESAFEYKKYIEHTILKHNLGIKLWVMSILLVYFIMDSISMNILKLIINETFPVIVFHQSW